MARVTRQAYKRRRPDNAKEFNHSRKEDRHTRGDQIMQRNLIIAGKKKTRKKSLRDERLQDERRLIHVKCKLIKIRILRSRETFRRNKFALLRAI